MLRKIAAAAVTGVLAATCLAATAATAEAYPNCNSTKREYISLYEYVVQPYYTGTGSRNCEMGYGAQSSAVHRLQSTLNDCYSVSIGEDSIYGNETRNAVEHAQRVGNVADDGIYGPNTRKAMRWGVYTARDGFTGCQTPGV